MKMGISFLAMGVRGLSGKRFPHVSHRFGCVLTQCHSFQVWRCPDNLFLYSHWSLGAPDLSGAGWSESYMRPCSIVEWIWCLVDEDEVPKSSLFLLQQCLRIHMHLLSFFVIGWFEPYSCSDSPLIRQIRKEACRSPSLCNCDFARSWIHLANSSRIIKSSNDLEFRYL
jgi:hypothetical protein